MNDQRTEGWILDRLGCVTASCVGQVMTKGGGATRKNYMMKLLCERLTGNREEGYQNAAMQRGTDLEAIARSAYEIDKGVMTVETGFVLHSTIAGFGASPDALVGADGLVEIKCPNTATHVDFLQGASIDKAYIWQMQAQMACTGRKWCDFVSFDDRLPESLQYKCVRVELDEVAQREMMTEISRFLTELEALQNSLTQQKEAA
jgi:putative phage-type endonuclease